MAAPARRRRPDRRREVEEALAAHGLEPAGPTRPDAVPRLAAALEELGPVFAEFGAYLATRPDLWHAERFLRLCVPAGAEPLDGARARLEEALAPPLDEVLAEFDDEPLETRRFWQTHRAKTRAGDAVLVSLRHPEAEGWVRRDTEMLGLVGEAALGIDWLPHAFGEALADFRRGLDRQLDFRHQAEAVEALAQDARDFELLQAPAVLRQLSSAGVLVRREPPGWRLDALAAPLGSEPGVEPDLLRQAQIESADLARYLCVAWLRQALVGRAFPVEPAPHNTVLLPGSRIAFIGGPFTALPAASQANLRAYLVAAAAQDPDEACAALLEEMRPPEGGGDLYALRLGFRQVVPFRDGGWSSRGDADSLAEHLFVHWRLLTEHGFRPRRHVLPFLRGLFTVAAAARQVAPERDALNEGLEDLRLLDGVNRFAEMMRPDRLDDNIDRLSSVAIELPKRVDAALDTLASGEVEIRLEDGARQEEERRGNALTAAAALAALLAALALWLPRLEGSGGWPEKAGAVAFVCLGGALLWTLRRL